ncbi:MAG: tRNA preQ1(34) S-adenosylmethionine ribosyltransferase-isomerase QueA [Myxococcales bacterium]|nr:tRNA preQ1(34) S-adenosylmethionine ribosyltransferase-isomerase QueA [Myxococcales bacterium]
MFMSLEYELDSYDFELPAELIAQHPPEQRHGGRLLVTRRDGSSSLDAQITDLPRLLPSGSVIVVNNTKVVPARLLGHKPSGGRVELLLTSPLGDTHDRMDDHLVITKSNKPLREGQTIAIEGGASAIIRSIVGPGRALVDLQGAESLSALLEQCGRVPLPPYIRQGTEQRQDRQRYQCTYASKPGAVAAPTAGLHISQSVIEGLEQAEIDIAALTLHVGPGTFLPVRVDDLRDHRVLSERYEISSQTAQRLNMAVQQGRPIVAVGTTCVRVLETLAQSYPRGEIQAHKDTTSLTIRPGHEFALVNGLLSNFHLPKSSLLVLVSAFAGRQRVLRAYRHAIEERYRFYSYGDATLWL